MVQSPQTGKLRHFLVIFFFMLNCFPESVIAIPIWVLSLWFTGEVLNYIMLILTYILNIETNSRFCLQFNNIGKIFKPRPINLLNSSPSDDWCSPFSFKEQFSGSYTPPVFCHDCDCCPHSLVPPLVYKCFPLCLNLCSQFTLSDLKSIFCFEQCPG